MTPVVYFFIAMTFAVAPFSQYLNDTGGYTPYINQGVSFATLDLCQQQMATRNISGEHCVAMQKTLTPTAPGLPPSGSGRFHPIDLDHQ